MKIQGLENAKWFDAPLKCVNPAKIMLNNDMAKGTGGVLGIRYLSNLTLFNGYKTVFLEYKNANPGQAGAALLASPPAYSGGLNGPLNVVGGFSDIMPVVATEIFDVVANVTVSKLGEVYKSGSYKNAFVMQNCYNFQYGANGITGDISVLGDSRITTNEYDDYYLVTDIAYYNRAEKQQLPRNRIYKNIKPTLVLSCSGYDMANFSIHYLDLYVNELCDVVIPLVTSSYISQDIVIPNRFFTPRLSGDVTKEDFTTHFISKLNLTPDIQKIGNLVMVSGVSRYENVLPTFPNIGVMDGLYAGAIYEPSNSTEFNIAFKTFDDIKNFFGDFGVKCFVNDEYSAINTPQSDIPDSLPNGTITPDSELPSFGFAPSVVVSVPSSPDNTSDIIELQSPNITPATFTRAHLLTSLDAKQLSSWLMTDDYTKNASELFADKLSAIISLKIFPFDFAIHDSAHITSSTPINVGGVVSPVNAPLIVDGYNCIFDLGVINIIPYYGDFSDYANATYNIYLPYCGITSIEPSDVLGRTITVKYIVDFVTGDCTALIYSNGILVKVSNGNVATEIPLTYTNANEVRIAKTIQNFSIAQSAVGALGSVASIAAGNVVGGTLGLVNSGINIAKTASFEPQLKTGAIGNPSSSTGLYMPQTPFIFISRRRIATPENYVDIAGKPTAFKGTVGSFSGYVSVIADNIKIEGATEKEISEIQSLLSSGIFV